MIPLRVVRIRFFVLKGTVMLLSNIAVKSCFDIIKFTKFLLHYRIVF